MFNRQVLDLDQEVVVVIGVVVVVVSISNGLKPDVHSVCSSACDMGHGTWGPARLDATRQGSPHWRGMAPPAVTVPDHLRLFDGLRRGSCLTASYPANPHSALSRCPRPVD